MKADLTEQLQALRDALMWCHEIWTTPEQAEKPFRSALRVEHSREISEEEVEAALEAQTKAIYDADPDDTPVDSTMRAMRAALLAAQAKRLEQIG